MVSLMDYTAVEAPFRYTPDQILYNHLQSDRQVSGLLTFSAQ